MSTVFNERYYLEQNADVAAQWGGTALEHFLAWGALEGRAPNATFDYQYYRANNADLATMNALQLFQHYQNHGYMEGRIPTSSYAAFDAATYLADYSDLGENGITEATALNHYLTFGINEGRVAKNTDGTDVSTTSGQSYSLTEGADNFTGTAGNDYFDGSLATTVAGRLMTFGNADRINGGAGTDTLFVQNNIAAATTITPASISSIETLDLDGSLQGAFALTIDLQNGDDALKTIKSGNSTTGTVTVQNVQGVPTSVELTNTNQNFTLINAAAQMTGTEDAIDLTLRSVTGAPTVTLRPSAAGSGYETVNLMSTGTVANVLGNLTDNVGTSLATINVSGSQNLTFNAADTSVTTIDASSFTGTLNVTVAAGAGAQNIMGGTGSDIINMNGSYTSADTIDGGDGTDRLTLTNAEAIAATSNQTNVSNVEVIGLSNGLTGAVAVNNFNATGLRFGANMAGVGTVSYAAGTNSLDLQNFVSVGNNLIVSVAGTATDDVLGITMGSAAAANAFGTGTVTINGAETVNLMSQGGANSFTGAFTITDTAATQTLNITGTQNITFTGAVRADSIDASGMTAGALLLNGGTGTTATAITGTGRADTLIGSTVGDIINGGAGNDTIANQVAGAITTSAADVLTGGAGNDTFQLYGDNANGTLTVIYATTSNITDFTVGTSGATDILALSSNVAHYAGVSAFTAGVAAAASGATAIQTVAQNAAATALLAGVDMVKLTTNVTTAGLTLTAAFDAAIGTGTITGAGANNDVFFSMYDSTNSRMVVGVVDAGADGTIAAADIVSLVGSIDMTAADYASFTNTHLQIV